MAINVQISEQYQGVVVPASNPQHTTIETTNYPVKESSEAPIGADSGISGILNGTYTYMCTFVTTDGETEGRVQSSDVTVTNKKIQLTQIPISTDSRVIARNIYRKPAAYSADVSPLLLLTQIADNTTTTYLDNTADADLGALVNRINTTGSIDYYVDEIKSVSNSTTLSYGWDSSFLGKSYASTAFGIHTMPANVGERNNAFGMYALNSVTTGYSNNAFGVHALNYNVTGNENTAMGASALMNNTANGNTAFGSSALKTITSGTGCTAVGYHALAVGTGVNNTAIGYNSMPALTTGTQNTALGFQTLLTAGANNYNTAIGYESLKNLADGSNNQNTALGYNAGALIIAGTSATGLNNCVLIGANTRTNGASDNNSIIIGKDAQGAGTNSVVLGHTTITKTVLRGDITLNKTVTAAGTTGAQTINNATGAVNFAAAEASLVVTNSLVTANSIIQLTVGTNDTTMKSAVAVAAAGSFTIYPDANPTAETRVNFTITN